LYASDELHIQNTAAQLC